jgi:proline iminopeptidase
MTAGCAFVPPAATESGFLQVEDDVRLFYQRFGTGTPTVSIPNRHELWPTLASLLPRHDVVAWDPRGRGLSDRPDDLARYGLEVEIADAEAIRRHIGAERVTYVGTSLWGSVAILYAARHPEIVERVVALGPLPIRASSMGASDAPIAHDLAAELAELEAIEREGRAGVDWYRHGVLSYRMQFANDYADLAKMAPLEAANMWQYPNERLDKILPVVFDGIRGSLGDWDWRDEVAGVRAPVLLLYGAREGWSLEGVRAYAELLRDVGWVEFHGAGHHVWNDRIEEVIPMLDAFFRGRWPEGVSRPHR